MRQTTWCRGNSSAPVFLTIVSGAASELEPCVRWPLRDEWHRWHPSKLLTFKTPSHILKPTYTINDQRFRAMDSLNSAPPPDDCLESHHFLKGGAPPPLFPPRTLLHFKVVLLKNSLLFPFLFLFFSKILRSLQGPPKTLFFSFQTTFTDFQVISWSSPSVCFQSSLSFTSQKQLWYDKYKIRLQSQACLLRLFLQIFGLHFHLRLIVNLIQIKALILFLLCQININAIFSVDNEMIYIFCMSLLHFFCMSLPKSLCSVFQKIATGKKKRNTKKSSVKFQRNLAARCAAVYCALCGCHLWQHCLLQESKGKSVRRKV